jgi:hypothetical protein
MIHRLARFFLARPAALATSLCVVAGPAFAAEPASRYTVIEESACRELASPDSSYERECSAPKGWRLLLGGSEDRSWIVLGRGKALWSTDNVLTSEAGLGYFILLQGKRVEWRQAAGAPATMRALIFRVSGQDPDHAGRSISNLVVIGLTGETPRLCGVAKTNEEARALADSLSSCTLPLRKLGH